MKPASLAAWGLRADKAASRLRAGLWQLLAALALAASAGPAAMAAPAAAGEETTRLPLLLRDDRGSEHRFEQLPQRIVSLMPSLTEIAAVLGAGPRLVGVDRYSNWPPEVSTLPRLGGLEDAQIEAIARLKPDLVLASSAARSLDKLEALGFRVLRLNSDSHADVRRSLALVAQLLGQPQRAEQLWAQMDQRMQAAAARVPAALRGQSVYFELGGGPYAAGSSSFIGQTLARLGLANIVPPELGAFPKLNPEFVVRARPALVMGARREQGALLARPGWQAIPAVRQRQVCGFDAQQYELLIRPGPRLGEAAELLADCLEGLDLREVSTAPAGRGATIAR